MIKARFALPDRKIPVSPMPFDLAHTCKICGKEILPLFYRGQWRERACQCEAQRIRQSEQEAQEALWREKAIQQSYAWLHPSELPPNASQSLSAQTFATFNVQRQPIQYQASLQGAYEACLEYAKHPEGNLALWGNTGVGKTHFLRAICNALREQHHTVARFVRATEFIAAYQHGSDEEQERLLRIAKTTKSVFELDDADKVPPSEARERVYYEVFNARCDMGLPIALSCNIYFAVYDKTDPTKIVHPGLVKYIGEAALSRFKQSLRIVEIAGEDQREARETS